MSMSGLTFSDVDGSNKVGYRDARDPLHYRGNVLEVSLACVMISSELQRVLMIKNKTTSNEFLALSVVLIPRFTIAHPHSPLTNLSQK